MARTMRIWPAALSFLIALLLEIVPLYTPLQPLRPPFVVMVMIYWALMWPERFGLFTAFCMGICLDILHGQLLGQNTFALLVVTYLTLHFHLQIRIFPLWQITAAVLALLSIDAVLQALIEGVAGLVPGGYLRWIRVVAGTVTWPLVMSMIDRVRQRADYRTPNLG